MRQLIRNLTNLIYIHSVEMILKAVLGCAQKADEL